MPFRLLFDRARRVIVIRFGAAMDEPSIKRMRAAVKAFVEREGDCPAIVDFTAVTEANVAGRFVAELARAGPVIIGEKRVLVAPRPEIFGLSRMYELNQPETGDRTLVVRTLAEAYAVVGVATLDLEKIDSDEAD